jgi:hypothetical protein
MGGWCLTHPRPLYPRERDPVPILQEAGWASASVWMDAENLAPTRLRDPNRSESLYRLRYPGRLAPWSYIGKLPNIMTS